MNNTDNTTHADELIIRLIELVGSLESALKTVNNTAVYPRLVSIAQTRQMLGNISRATIYRLLESGELTAIKVGNRTMINQTSINSLHNKPYTAGSHA